MSKRGNRRLPSICVDEHILPSVAQAFRGYLSTIEARNDGRFKGRDERSYLAKLYSQNVVFVTSDIEFAEEARRERLKHAGIIYIPNRMLEDEQVYFAQVAAAFVKGGCRDSRAAFRGCILYPGTDGVRLVRPKTESQLAFSWDWLIQVRNA